MSGYEDEWMRGLSPSAQKGLAEYRIMCMRGDILAFVGRDPGGITPYTVTCEMGWVMTDDMDAVNELHTIYGVILELVQAGKLVFRDGLLHATNLVRVTSLENRSGTLSYRVIRVYDGKQLIGGISREILDEEIRDEGWRVVDG